MIEHHLDLQGPGCYGKYAKPEAIALVLSRIKPSIRESVRMAVLHSSRITGRPFRELSSTWSIQYGGQTKGPQGQTRLQFRAPTLAAAAPTLFLQGRLFEDGPLPTATGFDLLGDVLADVSNLKRESLLFDADLLQTLARFSPIAQRGIQTIQLGGEHMHASPPPPINKQLTDAATSLAHETPSPKRVRISGRLNMIRVSDRAFELLLTQGDQVRAVWTEPSVVQLRDFLDQQVVVEGNAIFRPSGSLLRIDAQAIANARPQDSFFSKLPKPSTIPRRSLEPATSLRPSDNGFSAIFGKWPGNETDEELASVLKEIS